VVVSELHSVYNGHECEDVWANYKVWGIWAWCDYVWGAFRACIWVWIWLVRGWSRYDRGWLLRDDYVQVTLISWEILSGKGYLY